MAKLEGIIRGRLLNADRSERERMIYDVYEEMAKSAEEAIKQEFNRSVQMAAYVNQQTDQDVHRTILRSLKVRLGEGFPPDMVFKFSDDLRHWYGGELPEDFIDTVNKVIDEAINKWTLSGKPKKILLKMLED